MKQLFPLIVVVLISLVGGTAGPWAADQNAVPLDDDERLIESAGLACEGPGLLEFFRARARLETEPGRIDELVQRLAGSSVYEWIGANAELVAIGPHAISGLRSLANDLTAPQPRARARPRPAYVPPPPPPTRTPPPPPHPPPLY